MIDISFDNKIVEELPVELRKITHFRWLKALVHPIKYLYQDLKLQYKEWLILAKYSSQTLVIETILNERYAPINGGIYIINAEIEDDQQPYLFTDESGIDAEVFLYPAEAMPSNANDVTYLYNLDQITTRDYDFRIMIPSVLAITPAQELEIRAFINKVKIVAKKYIIQYY